MINEELLTDYIKRWRNHILKNPKIYPSLYDDEVKKNNYRISGIAYRGWREY